MNLFASEENFISLNLPDADIDYYPNFLSSEKASEYFNIFLKQIEWQQDDIKLFGKTYAQPRLTALYGDAGASYSYSGITMFPRPMFSELIQLKQAIEKVTHQKFNVVLLNLYRDGRDSNGWHSDDEKELGINPIIASVSLGIERTFQFKHKQNLNVRRNLILQEGSLLVMKGNTQHFWKHQIAKTKKIISPRINLTFRLII